MSKYPLPPYPSFGEIVYECATRSGLVRTNEKKSPLYEGLRAFKDVRCRPGLRPHEFPEFVLVDLEDRLAKFIGDDAIAFFISGGARRWLERYAQIVATHDATLLERDELTEQVLWPTIFSAGAAFMLGVLNKIFPSYKAEDLLSAKAPLGTFIQLLCTNGSSDIKKICEYRANKNEIDLATCRDTLEMWILGKSTPNLDRLTEVLNALNLGNNTEVKTWLLYARVIAKLSPIQKSLILRRMRQDENVPSAEEELFYLKRNLAWKKGEQLNIGPDRPYSELRDALYVASIPRDALHFEDMLQRLTTTWKPIENQTMHIIKWFQGRYCVLSGRRTEAYEHYLDAYNLGAGRDPDIYKIVLDEALALAGVLGDSRAVERLYGLLCMHNGETTWDGNPENLEAHFHRLFPAELYF